MILTFCSTDRRQEHLYEGEKIENKTKLRVFGHESGSEHLSWEMSKRIIINQAMTFFCIDDIERVLRGENGKDISFGDI